MAKLPSVENEISVLSLADQVYDHIKRMILTGKLKGGQRIPEESIAQSFGVSRTPIREALRRLEKNGLVNLFPRRYAEVARVTLEDKRHIGEVRIQLGALSVRLLAKRATPEDCGALRAIAVRCVQFAESGDFASCFEADSQLHCEIARRSGNGYLYELERSIDLKVQLLRNIEVLSSDHVKAGIALHAPLIEAICRHDAEGAQAILLEHLKKYYFDTDAVR
jgi:DNA-binding GntR family transcriptional regulator